VVAGKTAQKGAKLLTDGGAPANVSANFQSNQVWLTISGFDGTNFTVNVNATLLTIGQKSGTITISPSGSGLPFAPIALVVNASVSQPFGLIANPQSLSFQASSGSTTNPQSLTITSNESTTKLSFTATPSVPWINLSATSGQTPTSLIVSVDASTLHAATQIGTITLACNGLPECTGAAVQVTAIVISSTFKPSLTSFSFTAQTATTTAQSKFLSMESIGPAISFQAASDSPWLSVSPSSGVTPATLTITANPSGLMANTYSGTITVSDNASAAPAVKIGVSLSVAGGIRALAHAADGNGFLTEIILLNSDTADAPYSLKYDDNVGNPIQSNFVLQSGSSLNGTIPAGRSKSVITTGGGSSTTGGWAELNAPPTVSALAIYRQKRADIPEQEASTLLGANSSSRHFFLPFDNTGTFATSVAITNPSSTQRANLQVIFHYETNRPADNAPYTLDVRNHVANRLDNMFSFTANQRGVAEFISDTDITVVGFRFNSAGPFSTFDPIPVNLLSGTGSITSTIAHAADGNGFRTQIVLVNAGNADALYQIRFYDDAGNPQASNFQLDPGQSLSGTIPAGGSRTMQTTAVGSNTVGGFAELMAPPTVSGLAIFRQKRNDIPEQEASTPILGSGSRHFFLRFENIGQFTTSIALTNPSSSQNATINVRFRYDDGTSDTGSLMLKSRNHTANAVAAFFPNTANKSGVAEFMCDTEIAVVAFRFDSAGPFSTFQTINQ
jgi:hypothetical protein